ncbi:MAG: glycosyltransferase family 1 protein, partial [Deltaproteobacteria bacterium]
YNNFCRPMNLGQEADEVRRKYSIPDSYILYVGTIQPRKNIGTLVKAYSKLVKAKGVTHKLVITGRKGWLYAPLFELIKSEGLEQNVIFTGFVPDEELPYIYNGADLFVYLSLFEGFGIPPLEAMVCGVPVICSDATSLPEVVGDAGILVDPMDQEGVEKAILNVLISPSLRREMQEQGFLQAGKFSWERTARETLEVYREVVQGG